MSAGPIAERKTVLVGHVSGAHGIKGWVRIHSLTEPTEAIFEYRPWLLGESLEEITVRQGKKQGKQLVASLADVETRDQAEELAGRSISVYRDQFPELPDHEYYWTDLVGLSVRMTDGTALGSIERMLATGANDVMVVQGDRERLIPFVYGEYVTEVNLDDGFVVVQWDPDF